MTSDVNYTDIFFSFLAGVIRNFSACLSKFSVFIRSWPACFETYMRVLTVTNNRATTEKRKLTYHQSKMNEHFSLQRRKIKEENVSTARFLKY